MPLNLVQSVIIICEGISEKAYIQELNRFLDRNDCCITFAPKEVGTGHYGEVIKKYKNIYKDNKRSEICILVDHDIYLRNDNGNGYQYANKLKTIPNFLFSHNNFEDFLVMHLDNSKVKEWQSICDANNHFTIPLHSAQYTPLLIDNIFPNYKKGELPFDISTVALNNLRVNMQDPDIKFKSDFADLLLSKLPQHL